MPSPDIALLQVFGRQRVAHVVAEDGAQHSLGAAHIIGIDVGGIEQQRSILVDRENFRSVRWPKLLQPRSRKHASRSRRIAVDLCERGRETGLAVQAKTPQGVQRVAICVVGPARAVMPLAGMATKSAPVRRSVFFEGFPVTDIGWRCYACNESFFPTWDCDPRRFQDPSLQTPGKTPKFWEQCRPSQRRRSSPKAPFGCS